MLGEFSRRRRLKLSQAWLTIAFLLSAWGSVSCSISLFHDAISTSIEVPAPIDGSVVTAAKRFRFERDVASAQSAVLYEAWVSVEEPADFDLSFLSTVDVYAIVPGSSERVLLVQGSGFVPGSRFETLDIIFNEDLRYLVSDSRVNLEWEISPHRLFTGWQSVDTASLRFGIVLEIETD